MKKLIPITCFLLITAYFISCGDDTVTNTEYQYTQIDSLFFQKDYDSVYGATQINSGYQKMKVKKFKVSYDLVTNDQTDTMVSMSFTVGDGHVNFGQLHIGNECNGHFEFEHIFDKVLDSVQTPYYKVQHKDGNPSIYIVVRNLKAYKSY